ncbi:hypothetical protein [Christiangramia crocea]|uniref:Uncharacterized protein n=1 Tax=Christiangramia crocea TaxID=2904124 RepID=A0A9X2A6H7_9FLAO|nr:hypothetical protein [Gramella crocea]MCG9971011.1 hypothetical protein [Gramella crocea]
MKREIISFEEAKKAKEQGYNKPTVFYYGKDGKLHKSRQLLTQKSLRGSEESCLAPTESEYKEFTRNY